MRGFYYIEMYKLLKRKDVFWSLLISFSVPLLLGLLILTGSEIVQIGGEKFSAFQYAAMMFEFLKFLFFFYFIFIIFAASTFSGELEKGNINLLLIRAKDRKEVIISKYIALITILLIFLVVITFSGIISYYIFLYNTKFATHEFLGKDYLKFLYTITLSVFEIILIITITMLLSLFFNNYKTILLSIGTIILLKVLENVKEIKRFIPTYLANMDAWMSTAKTEHELFIKVIQNIGFLSLYILIIFVIAIRYFYEMDIKN
ncbi:ABC transporter permease [Thermoanaerobacter sp. A7A]|uniref:ABC transporter permease n=1 Tax=Thermoanaerobacter sp. A7A TaxID=1350366 RepID=UPI00041E262B|nr:ABC transporter permease [Thermoanaerobacter sp. A7A]